MASACGSAAAAAPATFELGREAMRAFHRAVACLAKLGRDAAVILRSEELVLHGADDGHSSAMQFAFRRSFFRATPSAQGHPAALEAHVVVSARALLVAIKGSPQRAGHADSLSLCLSGGGREPRQLVLKFGVRFGGSVRHRIPLLDLVPFLPGEPSAGPHAAALSPGLLARVLDHCSPSRGAGAACDEVTVSAVPREGIRVRSRDLLGAGSGAEETKTEVLVQRTDLEASSLDGQGGEVTFPGRGLRDFARAADALARDLEAVGLAEGPPLLELRFGVEGASVVCRLAAVLDGVVCSLQSFSAVLVVATRELPAELELTAPPAATAAASAAPPTATPSGRRPQPRQGAKRRTVSSQLGAADFDAFPEHTGSQAPAAPSLPPAGQLPCGGTTQVLHPPAPTQPCSATGPSQQPPAEPLWRKRAAPAEPPASAAAPAPTQPAHLAAGWAPAAAPGAWASPAAPPARAAPAGAWAAPGGAWAAAPAAGPSGAPSRLGSSGPASAALRAGQPAGAPGALAAGMHAPGVSAPPAAGLAAGPVPLLASQLCASVGPALDVADSDDELIGADPDEVALPRGDVADESFDWLDVDRLW